jgi:hypothetical protein
MEIAAAGGHNIILIGPGAGKLCLPSGYQYFTTYDFARSIRNY